MLVTGGLASIAIGSAEVYALTGTASSSNQGAWSATGTLLIPRFNATGNLMNDGKVLLTGGSTSANISLPDMVTEVYMPDL